MHSNGFHLSSQISEKYGEDKGAVVNMKGSVVRRIKEDLKLRIECEKSAEQGFCGEVEYIENMKRRKEEIWSTKRNRSMSW